MKDTEILYLNDQHEEIVADHIKKIKKLMYYATEEVGVVAEFIFLIPNMIFYTAIGFLTALKDGENDTEMKHALERIGICCENTTSELADILIDESEKKEIYKDIEKIKVNQN